MTVIVAPERSLDQRMAALATANRIRIDRANLKKALRLGKIMVTDVLADPPSCVFSMRAEALLRAVPKIGATKARRILLDCRVSGSKTVAGLSPRQRDELIRRLT